MKNQKQSLRQRKILQMFNNIVKCSEKKPTDFVVTEQYQRSVVSELPVKADDVETAIRFACNNRRHRRSTVEIKTGGVLVASQVNLDSPWFKVFN